MENSYGIGVTNRYELFYVDEEGSDPLETLIQIKQKTNKKVDTGKSQGPIAAGIQQINKSAEKENKSATLNKNQTLDPLTKPTRPIQNLKQKIVKDNQTVLESKGKISRDGKFFSCSFFKKKKIKIFFNHKKKLKKSHVFTRPKKITGF